MIEPSKEDVKQLQLFKTDTIANMGIVSVSIIQDVREYTAKLTEKIAKSIDTKPYYAKIEQYLIKNYGNMYNMYKKQITDAFNKSGVLQKSLVENALSETIKWKPSKLYETLPDTKEFKITNSILDRKSVLKRNKILSDRVTKIIADGFDKGESISKIQRKLDIEFGFRDELGRITDKSKALIKSGKFSHKNGHIYQTYRIARTETMRMAAIQANRIFDELDMTDKRQKMLAYIDKRTREQSIQMNGQLSNSRGEFQYPDGNWYRHGTAPARWSINDRESTVIVFLRDEENQSETIHSFEADRNIEDQKKVKAMNKKSK